MTDYFYYFIYLFGPKSSAQGWLRVFSSNTQSTGPDRSIPGWNILMPLTTNGARGLEDDTQWGIPHWVRCMWNQESNSSLWACQVWAPTLWVNILVYKNRFHWLDLGTESLKIQNLLYAHPLFSLSRVFL